MKVERPFAYCCADGGGKIEFCDCAKKDHGVALFDVSIVDLAREILVTAIKEAEDREVKNSGSYLKGLSAKVAGAEAATIDTWLALDAVILALRSHPPATPTPEQRAAMTELQRAGQEVDAEEPVIRWKDAMGQIQEARTSNEVYTAWLMASEHPKVWHYARRFLYAAGIIDDGGKPLISTRIAARKGGE